MPLTVHKVGKTHKEFNNGLFLNKFIFPQLHPLKVLDTQE